MLAPLLLGATIFVLNTEEFGKYSFWLAVFSLITPISTLGIKDYLVSKFTKQKHQVNLPIYITSVTFLIFFYLIISFIIFVILENNLNIYLKFLLMLSLIGNVAIVGQASLEASEKSFLNAKILTFVFVFGALARLLFLITKNPELIIISHAFEPILFLTFMYKFNEQFKISVKSIKTYSLKHIFGVAKISLPLISTTFLVNIYMRADQIIIGKMMDFTSLGKFSVAVRLVEISYVFGIAYSASVFPNLSKLFYLSDQNNYFYSMKNTILFMTFLSTLICSLYYSSSNILVQTLMDDKDIAVMNVLKIYCLSIYSVFIGIILSKHLILTKRYNIIFFTALVGAILNLAFNLVLIPHFGIDGAAYGTLLAMVPTLIIPAYFLVKDSQKNATK